MTLIPGLAAAVLLVWALGGHLGRVTLLRFRRTLLLYSALAGQLVAFGPVRLLADRQVEQMQIATYILLLAFYLVNRRVPGLWLVALGIGANALVIVANRGLMPVVPKAILASGWTLKDYADVYPNVVVRAGAPLWYLGDVFAMPRFPGSAVLSIGDISIIAGAWLLLQRAASLPSTALRRRAPSIQVLPLAACGLLVAALALLGARETIVAAVAALGGATLGSLMLATLDRRPPALRCLAVSGLLGIGALALGQSTAGGPTSILVAALVGAVAALSVLTAASTLRRTQAGTSR